MSSTGYEGGNARNDRERGHSRCGRLHTCTPKIHSTLDFNGSIPGAGAEVGASVPLQLSL